MRWYLEYIHGGGEEDISEGASEGRLWDISCAIDLWSPQFRMELSSGNWEYS